MQIDTAQAFKVGVAAVWNVKEGLGWSWTRSAPLCEELKREFFEVPHAYTHSVRNGCELQCSVSATQQLIRYQLPTLYHLL